MGKKGGKTAEKTLSTSKSRKIERKQSTWTIRSNPGPHSREESVPLGFVVRNLLGLTDNLRETRIVLKNQEVKVDEVVRKDYRFPVGLFDIITIEKIKKKYLLALDKLGRFEVRELDFKEKSSKLCKITGKKTVAKNKIVVESQDGRIFSDDKNEISTGDVLKIELPNQKIVKIFKLVEGNTAIVTGGRRVSTIGTVLRVQTGTMKRPPLISLKPKDGDEFLTVKDKIFIVGEKSVELKGLETKGE